MEMSDFKKNTLSSFNAKCNFLIFLITFVIHCDLNMFLWDSGICLAACWTQVSFYWPIRSVPDQLVQQSFSVHLETEARCCLSSGVTVKSLRCLWLCVRSRLIMKRFEPQATTESKRPFNKIMNNFVANVSLMSWNCLIALD